MTGKQEVCFVTSTCWMFWSPSWTMNTYINIHLKCHILHILRILKSPISKITFLMRLEAFLPSLSFSFINTTALNLKTWPSVSKWLCKCNQIVHKIANDQPIIAPGEYQWWKSCYCSLILHSAQSFHRIKLNHVG